MNLSAPKTQRTRMRIFQKLLKQTNDKSKLTDFYSAKKSIFKPGPSWLKALCLTTTFIIFGFLSQLFLDSTWFTSSVAYFFSYNFREVEPGKIYRSGELSQAALEKYILKYKIKTVIDLRHGGDNAKRNGFSEKLLTESLGAKYEWVPLVGTNTHQKAGLNKLVTLSESTEGPVLIHCSSGTHRSGIATAIWLMSAENKKPVDAIKQLSLKYGYLYWERRFKSWYLGHQTLDAVIWRYMEIYGKEEIKFKEWLRSLEGEL